MVARILGDPRNARGQFLGDVSPGRTWRDLRDRAEAVLVDVRTRAEWAYVGGPDLASLGKPVVQVEWLMFPTMENNPGFLEQLRERGVMPDRTIYLICRSGVRSRQAAELLALHGYATYNVADGFEGQLDADGHRGVGGWRAEGLPWRQS